MGTPERLADVDRELATFGKSDDVLEAVIRRARDGAPGALDAIDALLDGLASPSPLDPNKRREPRRTQTQPFEAPHLALNTSHTPVEIKSVAAPSTAVEPAPAQPEIARELHPSVADEPFDDERTDAALDLGELRAAAPHGVDAGGGELLHAALAAQLTAAPQAGSLDTPADSPDLGTIDSALLARDESAADAHDGEVPSAATPLADLFDESSLPSSPPPAPAIEGLVALFDDALPAPQPEPNGLQDLAELLGGDLEEALGMGGPSLEGSLPLDDVEGPATGLFGSESPPRSDGDALDAQLDAIMGEPLAHAVEPVDLPPSGEFELMIDEDVLVLDDVEPRATSDDEGDDGPIHPTVQSSQPPPLPSSSAPRKS